MAPNSSAYPTSYPTSTSSHNQVNRPFKPSAEPLSSCFSLHSPSRWVTTIPNGECHRRMRTRSQTILNCHCKVSWRPFLYQHSRIALFRLHTTANLRPFQCKDLTMLWSTVIHSWIITLIQLHLPVPGRMNGIRVRASIGSIDIRFLPLLQNANSRYYCWLIFPSLGPCRTLFSSRTVCV